MSEFIWSEIYRPHTVDDCILPKRIKDKFKAYVKSGEIPNLILSGPPGSGKTTSAKAMCEEIGLNHLFINGSKERGIDVLRTKVISYASTVALAGGRKVIIIDEADNLTPDAQMAFRATIEEFSSNCTFIFTCNFKAKILDALHSRCTMVDFSLRKDEKLEMVATFYRRVVEILKKENVEFDKNVVSEVIKNHFPDYRRTFNELQALAAQGPIDPGALAGLNASRELSVLVEYLKTKNFGEMRKWVNSNSDVDSSKIYRMIYDRVYDILDSSSIPLAVVTLNDYQYKEAFVADREINLCACLTQLMADCEFK